MEGNPLTVKQLAAFLARESMDVKGVHVYLDMGRTNGEVLVPIISMVHDKAEKRVRLMTKYSGASEMVAEG